MTTTYRLRDLIKPVSILSVALLSVLFATAAVSSPTPSDLVPQARQSKAKDPRAGLLTDEDIALIKVYEVDLNPSSGKPPRVTIPESRLKDFLEEFREDDRIPRGKSAQRAFLRADGSKQLQLLFQLRAREYYKDVRIRGDIASLREWNALHRSYLLGYFGNHFGQGKVEKLTLKPQGRDAKRVAMTNFYLLTQTKVDGVPMIDRNNPAESLLLQWGLPREDAKFAAPDVENWRPYFKDRNDKRFKELVGWIKSLVRTNQDSTYDIQFPAPERED